MRTHRHRTRCRDLRWHTATRIADRSDMIVADTVAAFPAQPDPQRLEADYCVRLGVSFARLLADAILGGRLDPRGAAISELRRAGRRARALTRSVVQFAHIAMSTAIDELSLDPQLRRQHRAVAAGGANRPPRRVRRARRLDDARTIVFAAATRRSPIADDAAHAARARRRAAQGMPPRRALRALAVADADRHRQSLGDQPGARLRRRRSRARAHGHPGAHVLPPARLGGALQAKTRSRCCCRKRRRKTRCRWPNGHGRWSKSG